MFRMLSVVFDTWNLTFFFFGLSRAIFEKVKNFYGTFSLDPCNFFEFWLK